MTFDDIVINNRETNSSFHLKLAQNWRIRGEPKLLHSPLIYAAFEYRLAIERIVFELYFLMEKENLLPGKLFSKAELKKVDSFSSITKIIFQNAKNKNLLFRALIFNKTFASVFALSKAKLSLPDIGKLQKYWHELSNFCHKQISPIETWESRKWIEMGYKLLNEIENYMWEMTIKNDLGWLEIKSLAPALKDERDLFLNGKINEKELYNRMKLIKPVLEFREDFQKLIIRRF